MKDNELISNCKWINPTTDLTADMTGKKTFSCTLAVITLILFLSQCEPSWCWIRNMQTLIACFDLKCVLKCKWVFFLLNFQLFLTQASQATCFLGKYWLIYFKLHFKCSTYPTLEEWIQFSLYGSPHLFPSQTHLLPSPVSILFLLLHHPLSSYSTSCYPLAH